MSEIKEYDALVVVTPKDFERLSPQYNKLVELLPIRQIRFIGNTEVGELVIKANLGDKVTFINEDDIIPFSDVHSVLSEIMKDILQGTELPKGITGWYYQQFLKMKYAYICEDEYYMTWDGDTVPCRSFSMFSNNGQPYFDLKTELHEEYFDTLGILFPGMFKCISKSFISEHMLFRTDIMKSLIEAIEANNDIKGSVFYEKILNAVGGDKIQDSSFSEFETYGTYVAFNYCDVYRLRDWHSFRYAGEFFDINAITDRDYEWLGRDFYALSFEKGNFVREDHKNLFDNPEYQKKMSARQMLEVAQQEFGEGSYQENWDNDICVSSSTQNIEGNSSEAESDMDYSVFDIPTIIVIVSYNGQYFMEKNIESIRNTVPEGTYSILVVDNASTDGTREWLEDQEDVVLVANEENVGFSKACNQAAKVIIDSGLGDSDIFLLNNDTRLCENSLYYLKKTLHSNDNIGATGSVSNYAGNEQQIDIEFDSVDKYIEFGRNNNVDMENASEDRIRLSGFAMLIRGGLWQQTGGMDEEFSPGFFEDDDLSMKISKLGYRLVLCKNSFIYHAGSQSFAKRADVEQLLLNHYQLFVDKYGFYIIDKAYPDRDVISKLPFDSTDEVNVLQTGCGLGADLKAISSLYPNSNVFGIEKDKSMYDILCHTIPSFKSVEDMANTITGKVFDVLWIKDDITNYSQREKELLASVCTDDCIVIRNMPDEISTDIDFSKIKLIIWDLDNTFWSGIISEGDVEVPTENIQLIKDLSEAGIINSISSKNDSAIVLSKLDELEISEYFVFNDINWDNKGEQIKNKLDDMHLRAENVLFIDDEVRNLNEAKYYCPEILTASPGDIARLYEFTKGLNKKDESLSRLKEYKLLEEKRSDSLKYNNKKEFLADSNIVVSISENFEGIEDRIAELVARTNQLNFTKVRDEKNKIYSLLQNPDIKKGYISVSDKYGDYGIVGFYCYEEGNEKIRHFLFSCRIMGMGVPKYIFDLLGKPQIDVISPVAVNLVDSELVTWIKLTEEGSKENQRTNGKIKVLLKGPCDLSSIEPYLIGGDITTEFNFVNDEGFIITGQNHTMHIYQSEMLTDSELSEIINDAPFITKEDFETSIFSKEYDVICLSMLPDAHAGLYKNKQTGNYISFGSTNFDLTDSSNTQGYIDGTIVNHFYPFTEDIIDSFADKWEYVGTTDPMELLRNLDYIYENVMGNPTIVLILGSEIEYEGENEEFANHSKRHQEMNELIRAFAEDHDRIRLIEATKYIHSQEDYEDSINHFARNVYYDMATELVGYINDKCSQLMNNDESTTKVEFSFEDFNERCIQIFNQVETDRKIEIDKLLEGDKHKYIGKSILFILPLGITSGGGNVILHEAQALRWYGIDAQILNIESQKKEYVKNYGGYSVPVIFIDDYENSLEICKSFDVVCATNWQTVYVAHFEEISKYTKTAYYIQDYEPYFYNNQSDEYKWAYESYNLIDDMVKMTKTSWNYMELKQNNGVVAEILGPSLNIDLFRPADCRSCDKIVITAMVRPHSPQRSPELTMRVFRYIKNKYGNKVELHIFGNSIVDDAWFFENIQDDFEYINHELTSSNETVRILQESHIFVDFSSFQAMGLTALEAMACGCAVIVPMNGGTHEYARDMINSLIIDTQIEENCVNNLINLIENKRLREAISCQAIIDANKYYPERTALFLARTVF